MRLTRKNEIYLGGYEPMCAFNEAFSKLGKLEDVEDELGIDLETLFKALKKGIYTTEGFVGYVELSLLCGVWYLTNEEECLALPVDSYGQCWALTEGELL